MDGEHAFVEHSDAPSQREEKPIINIVGEKVALGPLHRGILPFMVRWLNDFEVTFLSGDPLRPMSGEAIEAMYEHDSKGEQRDRVDFIVYERATMRLIGIMELRHINTRNHNAEFGILIGEKDCWGKGYGTEATMLMLDYAFSVLGLHNVLLDTDSYNERAIRAYTRAGFRVIGHRREAKRWGDKFYDTVLMDCLSTEFRSSLKPIVNLP